MKMKKIISLFASFCVFGFCSVTAQSNYKTAIGLRLGSPFGITAKTFVSKTDAIEGILHAYSNDIGFTGLYERHGKIGNIPEFNVYFGAGAGIAIHNINNNYNNYASIGIDGILGVEYTISSIPINVSIDVKPYINIVPDIEISQRTIDAALSVRYYF